METLSPGALRTFDYFDASDDPLARRAAAPPPEVRRALEALGYAPLGVALAVFRLNGHEIVTGVWAGGDGRALAEVEAGTGRVELATLFDDGAAWTHSHHGGRCRVRSTAPSSERVVSSR